MENLEKVLDEEIKKAKELVSLLERANELIQSLKARTTDVLVRLDGKEIISSLEKYRNFQITNCDKLVKNHKM